MLYHPTAFPKGGIAPVTYLWRAPQNEEPVHRQMWLWVHPSASAELQHAFHKIAPLHQGEKIHRWLHHVYLGLMNVSISGDHRAEGRVGALRTHWTTQSYDP